MIVWTEIKLVDFLLHFMFFVIVMEKNSLHIVAYMNFLHPLYSGDKDEARKEHVDDLSQLDKKARLKPSHAVRR